MSGVAGKKEICTAIVLSAGQGKRMNAAVQKQYIEIAGKPVICHTLAVFQQSPLIDDIVLVVGKGQEAFAKAEIVEKYGFTKVSTVVSGGKERHDSVWEGLKAIRDGKTGVRNTDGYVFIHDGARMLVDEAILARGYEAVCRYGACVAGMPNKDTVKIADDDGFVVQTPPRKYVWTIQTPQIFEISLITEAYSRLMREQYIRVTDDAMVVEQMLGARVRLFEASYENIKITTPEDLQIAAEFLRRRGVTV